jgi:hypothetical protein
MQWRLNVLRYQLALALVVVGCAREPETVTRDKPASSKLNFDHLPSPAPIDPLR